MHGTRGGWHEGAWRVGAIVSAKEAALQLHRALWGIRTRIRSASCVDNSHRMLRQMHASRTGRGRCINWGLGKSLVSGSRLCPPPCTSTRHVTRERGLGGVAPKSGLKERRSPFVLPVAARDFDLGEGFNTQVITLWCFNIVPDILSSVTPLSQTLSTLV